MFSTSLARITRKALALFACTGAILALTAGPVQAGHGGGLHIDDANWDGNTLTADGGADKPNKGGGPVEVWNDDGLNPVSLGLATLPNSGNWTFTGDVCAETIIATQDTVTTGPSR